MREVDASIRYREGTADVLITVECRKRGRRENDTWIEQLATKRTKIGAAKTIAVSAAGFSDSARITAQHHGIELRTLSEVSASDIDGWFLPGGGAVQVFREVEDFLCVWYYRGPDGEAEDTPHGVQDPSLPVFYNDHIESPFPADILFQHIEKMHPEAFWSIPLDGTKTPLQFTIKFPKGQVRVNTDAGQRDVHHVLICAAISYQSAVFPLESGKHHVYAAPGGEVVQHTSFQTEMFGHSVRFDHQSDSEGKSHASCEFSPRPKPPAT